MLIDTHTLDIFVHRDTAADPFALLGTTDSRKYGRVAAGYRVALQIRESLCSSRLRHVPGDPSRCASGQPSGAVAERVSANACLPR